MMMPDAYVFLFEKDGEDFFDNIWGFSLKFMHD